MWRHIQCISLTSFCGFANQSPIPNAHLKQESPPAWTQEAYRPPCSHSNFLAIAGGGGGPSTKIFFPQSEHVSSQICCQKFFPLLRPGTPPPRKIWDEVPPPPKNLRPGTPPQKIWDKVPPPPRNVNRQTPVKTVPSRHTTYAGGNKYCKTLVMEIKFNTMQT